MKVRSGGRWERLWDCGRGFIGLIADWIKTFANLQFYIDLGAKVFRGGYGVGEEVLEFEYLAISDSEDNAVMNRILYEYFISLRLMKLKGY